MQVRCAEQGTGADRKNASVFSASSPPALTVMFKRTAIVLLAVAAIGGALWGADVIADRSYQLAVVAPASLYSLPPHEYPKSNPTVATLQPGQPIRVLRLRYGKDFQAFRVETSMVRLGGLWVVTALRSCLVARHVRVNYALESRRAVQRER
jgi:hypothetical protein